jgi:glutamyl-tRNA synthetase
VTLADRPEPPLQILTLLAHSLGLAEDGEQPQPSRLVERFDPDRLPVVPWIWS